MNSMKRLFYISLLTFMLFEITNVYFIMPMPGSQEMNSIDLAYFLFRGRWVFRVLLAVIILYSWAKAKWKYAWYPFLFIFTLLAVIYIFNFVMSADHMFEQPKKLVMASAADNETDSARLIIGVAIN